MLSSSFSRFRGVSIPIRNLSKIRGSYMERREAQRAKLAGNGPVDEDTPKFSTMIRQLYRKSHPDLLRASHPEFAACNDQSMQVLNSVLTDIKTYNQYPPQIVKRIPFYIKVPGTMVLNNVDLNIRTAGGDCKKQITRTFQSFFVDAGISADGKFVWDKEYFPTKTVAEAQEYADEIRDQAMRKKAYEDAASK